MFHHASPNGYSFWKHIEPAGGSESRLCSHPDTVRRTEKRSQIRAPPPRVAAHAMFATTVVRQPDVLQPTQELYRELSYRTKSSKHRASVATAANLSRRRTWQAQPRHNMAHTHAHAPPSQARAAASDPILHGCINSLLNAPAMSPQMLSRMCA